MPAPYRRLGRIVKAHGTSGEVSVAPTGDLAFALRTGADVWVVPPMGSGATPRRVEGVRSGPKNLLIRISGIDTPALAHEAVGRWLLTAGEEPGSVAGSDELIGMRVRDRMRGEIGTVTDVIVTGANDVLVVDGGRFGQVLVPVINDVIDEVDTSAGLIEVVLLDGLIDEGE